MPLRVRWLGETQGGFIGAYLTVRIYWRGVDRRSVSLSKRRLQIVRPIRYPTIRILKSLYISFLQKLECKVRGDHEAVCGNALINAHICESPELKIYIDEPIEQTTELEKANNHRCHLCINDGLNLPL